MIVVEGAAEKNSYQGSWALCRIRWAGALASLDNVYTYIWTLWEEAGGWVLLFFL